MTRSAATGPLVIAEAGHATLADLPSMLRVDAVHEPVASHHAGYQDLLGAFVDFHDRAAPFYANLPSSFPKDLEP